jgi:hypothetical protein
MLDSNRVAAVLVGPSRDIARRENPGYARFKIGVNDDAAIYRDSRRFGEFYARAHADASDNKVRLDHASAFELDFRAANRGCRVLEVKDHPMLLVKRPHKFP